MAKGGKTKRVIKKRVATKAPTGARAHVRASKKVQHRKWWLSTWQLIAVALLIAIGVCYVWCRHVPSPQSVFDKYLANSLNQTNVQRVIGSVGNDDSTISGIWSASLDSPTSYREQSNLSCHYSNNELTVDLSYLSDKGQQYVRLNNIDGTIVLGGESQDMAAKYQPVMDQWYEFASDDLDHFTQSQLENQVLVGFTSVVAPKVDQPQALASIKQSGVYEILSITSYGRLQRRVYVLTIRTHRDAYVKMLETTVPLLSNRSEVVDNLFGDRPSVDTTLGIRVNGEQLYTTTQVPDPCQQLGAKLFGERIVGAAKWRDVTLVPVEKQPAIAIPSNAKPFEDYFKALGVSL